MNSNVVARYGRIARFSNYIVKSESDTTSSVQIPSLTMDDLHHRTGGADVSRLLHWFARSIFSAFMTSDTQSENGFLDYLKLILDHVLFLGTLELKVSNELYKLLDGYPLPNLTIRVLLDSIGESSFTIVCKLTEESSAKTLATNVRRFVYVSRATRKSVQLPEWWRQKYSSHVPKNQGLTWPVLDVPASNTHTHEGKVRWRDTDHIGHMNYNSYITFCFDAAMSAIKKNFYVGFYDDILNYNIKTIRLLYLREALPGSSLNVVTWQHINDPMLLHFSIHREGNCIFQSSMEFFTSSKL